MKYVGQTGSYFRSRFSEHFRDFKHTNYKSKFAQHLLENDHSIDPLDDIMEVLHTASKGKLMDTLEKFHIYKITLENMQINDKNTSKPNAIFDTLIREKELADNLAIDNPPPPSSIHSPHTSSSVQEEPLSYEPREKAHHS